MRPNTLYRSKVALQAAAMQVIVCNALLGYDGTAGIACSLCVCLPCTFATVRVALTFVVYWLHHQRELAGGRLSHRLSSLPCACPIRDGQAQARMTCCRCLCLFMIVC